MSTTPEEQAPEPTTLEAQAETLYQQAVRLNPPNAQTDVPLAQKQQAAVLYQQAVVLGNTSAMVNLGLMYVRGELGEPDWPQVAELWRKAAKLGNADAMVNLGVMYYHGDLGAPDRLQAEALWQKAAGLGNAMAMNNLGSMYDNGDLGAPNKPKAVEWYQKATALGHANAMFNLGVMYYNGDLGNPNMPKAAELWERAAGLGYAKAMFNLGGMYYNGDLGNPSMPRASELWERAAGLGHAKAMVNLGDMYARGELGEPDAPLAASWYQKAADLGDVDAKNKLSEMFCLSNFGKSDVIKSVNDYEKANELGVAKASMMLGIMFLVGKIGEVNVHKAWEYFKTAEQQGENIAINFQVEDKLKDLGLADTLCKEITANLIWLEQVFFDLRQAHMIDDKNHIGQWELSHFTSWPTFESLLPKPESKPEPDRNCLRQYHVDYMNDPTEGRRLLDFEKLKAEDKRSDAGKTSAVLRDLFDQYYHHNLSARPHDNPSCANSVDLLPSVFIVSMTQDSDRLDLWRAYGENGDGYCLTFAIDPPKHNGDFDDRTSQFHMMNIDTDISPVGWQDDVRKAGPRSDPKAKKAPPLVLRSIKYSDAEVIDALGQLDGPITALIKLRDGLQDKLTDASKLEECQEKISRQMVAILLELLYLYKDEQYSTEHEVRALEVLRIHHPRIHCDERGPGRLYVETEPFLFKTPTRIIVGPKVADKQAALWNLRWRLNQCGYARTTSVQESAVQYR